MAAGGRQGVRSDDLVLFDLAKTDNQNDILVKISDYPPDMGRLLRKFTLWTIFGA